MSEPKRSAGLQQSDGLPGNVEIDMFTIKDPTQLSFKQAYIFLPLLKMPKTTLFSEKIEWDPEAIGEIQITSDLISHWLETSLGNQEVQDILIEALSELRCIKSTADYSCRTDHRRVTQRHKNLDDPCGHEHAVSSHQWFMEGPKDHFIALEDAFVEQIKPHSEKSSVSQLEAAKSNLMLQEYNMLIAFAVKELEVWGDCWDEEGYQGIMPRLKKLMRTYTSEEWCDLPVEMTNSITGAFAHFKSLDAQALRQLSQITKQSAERCLQITDERKLDIGKKTKNRWMDTVDRAGETAEYWSQTAKAQDTHAANAWRNLEVQSPLEIVNDMKSRTHSSWKEDLVKLETDRALQISEQALQELLKMVEEDSAPKLKSKKKKAKRKNKASMPLSNVEDLNLLDKTILTDKAEEESTPEKTLTEKIISEKAESHTNATSQKSVSDQPLPAKQSTTRRLYSQVLKQDWKAGQEWLSSFASCSAV